MNKPKDSLPAGRSARRLQKRLLLGLIILACLTPLGVLFPRMAGSGDAWGEWGPAYLEKVLGYVPQGLMRTSHIWRPLLPDYAVLPEGLTIQSQLFSYLLSGFAGLLLVLSVMIAITRIVRKHER